MPRSPKITVICVALTVLTAVAYGPVIRNGFVNFDGDTYLTANRHVQAGLSWQSIRWAFTTPYASNWNPITWLSHMVDRQLFGSYALGHHAMGVVWYAANAVVLFLVLLQLTGRAAGRLPVASRKRHGAQVSLAAEKEVSTEVQSLPRTRHLLARTSWIDLVSTLFR